MINENHVQVNFRMPEYLRDHLKDLAKSNRRSMNAEIVFHLERAFAANDENEKPAALS